MANDDASFEERSLRADSDQNNRSGQNGNRGCRMHRDTQRAVVGVGLNRMDVSDLNDNQKSQQRQTHQSRGPESRCPRATGVLLKPDQMAIPYLKDTQAWTRARGIGCFFGGLWQNWCAAEGLHRLNC